jgi:hypothetical protein
MRTKQEILDDVRDSQSTPYLEECRLEVLIDIRDILAKPTGGTGGSCSPSIEMTYPIHRGGCCVCSGSCAHSGAHSYCNQHSK